jgi:hypothetical protein
MKADRSDSPVEVAGGAALRCERCGRFDAQEVAGRVLCTDCYSNAGACCAECAWDGDAECETSSSEADRTRAAGTKKEPDYSGS